jgi:hypothetical protein
MIPPGSIPLKTWYLTQSEHLGLQVRCLEMRLKSGYYRPIQTHRVNRRVIYVLPNQTLTPSDRVCPHCGNRLRN